MRVRFEAMVMVGVLLPLGCEIQLDEGGVAGAGRLLEAGSDESALARACASGSTLPGMDVSYYQGTIDWDAVKGDGIEYAFIRVSDGLSVVDSKFERNWSEAKRVGVRRSVYQFFRPGQSAIAQANLLLDRMGPLEPGDLPPVIDVEASSGLSASTVANRVQQWVQHVESQIGVRPIIYSGSYFWRDQVGSPAWAIEYPLWVAHYTTGCPLTPSPWPSWTFHQYTDSGRVRGIAGNVDRNYFNGTRADLDALSVGGSGPGIPMPAACDVLPEAGGAIDEDDPCVSLNGPSQYLRAANGGHGGDHVWTGVTGAAHAVASADWTVRVRNDGMHRLDVYVGAGLGTSKMARYWVQHADGESQVVIDQSAADGFVTLGIFRFTADTAGQVRLPDNTGEPSSLGRRIAIDALLVTPIDEADMPPPPPPGACEVAETGGILEEDGPCASFGGPDEYLRAVEGEGHGGGYVWTGATASTQAANFIDWTIDVPTTQAWLVEAYVEAGAATSQSARYSVEHTGGADEVVVNQAATNGFATLGVFRFSQSSDGSVRLADNTGESSSLNRRISIDALRLQPAQGCDRVRITAPSGLNVRPAPNTSNSPSGTLSGGQRVPWVASVEGQAVNGETEWYRVSGSVSGYVSARYATCE